MGENAPRGPPGEHEVLTEAVVKVPWQTEP
jgi:hypothetical protein